MYKDSWINYMWMNYYSQIVDSIIYDAFAEFN